MTATDGELLLQAVLREPAEDTPRLVYADYLQEQGHAARAEFVRVQCEIARLPLRPRWRCHITEWTHPFNGPVRGEAVIYSNQKVNPYVRQTVDLLHHARDARVRVVYGAVCEFLPVRETYDEPREFRVRFVVTGEPDPNRERSDELQQRERELWGDIHELLPREMGAYLTLGTPDTFGNASIAARVHRGFVDEMRLSAADWLSHAADPLARHPVTKVTLTTYPRDETGRYVTLREFGEHWPKITFRFAGEF